MTPLVVRRSRGKAFLVFVVAMGFAGLCAWVSAQPELFRPNPARLWIVRAGIPFFGLGALLVLRQILSRVPVLVADEEGITLPQYRIAWREISRLYVYHQQGYRFVGVALVDTEAFVARQGPLRRMLLRANLSFGAPAISVAEVNLPLSIDELLARIAVIQPSKVEARNP